MLTLNGEIYADSTSSYFAVAVDMNTDINTSTNLTLNDLVPQNLVDVDNAYFGCIIPYSGRYYIKTNANKIGTKDVLDPFYVEVKCSEFSTVGTHSVYPVISTMPYTALTTNMSGTKFIAIPKGNSGTFQTSFTTKSSALEGSIAWYYAWYTQAAKLTIGGTLSYKKSFEGSNVSIVFYKTVNGTKTSIGNMSVTLSHTGTNGTDAYLMDIEKTMNQATASGTIYSITASLSNYSVTTQCDDSGGMEDPM